jgi:hypothetical protein
MTPYSTASSIPIPSGEALLARVAEGLDPQPDPWAVDPSGWIRTRLGESTWSKQDEILVSVRDNRRTAVRSCHTSGKSHIASRAIAHWIETHPIDNTFIVSTAPSAPQVKAILWRYLKSIHRKAGLRGYITEAEVPEWKIDGSLVGWGRKPADLTSKEDAATAFQGTHAKYLLVILDEACGIPGWLWTAVASIATQPTNRILAIGNPDNPASHFAKLFRPNSGWDTIKISAFDCPAFTGEVVSQEIADNLIGPEFVAEAAADWGADSPLYFAKVLAEFPVTSDDNLIPMNWIQNAVDRDLSGEAIADYGKYVLDVAREGKDEAVLGYSRAGMFRVIKTRRGIGDVTKLGDWLDAEFFQHPATKFIIDADGVGGGVFDHARSRGLPVSAFYAGRRAFDAKKFVDRRSEQWWMVRDLFKDGLFDIDREDEALQAQLSSIKYLEEPNGRIRVESKKEMKKRGLPSPDRADALMMSTAPYDDWTDSYTEPLVRDGWHRDGSETITGDLLNRPLC